MVRTSTRVLVLVRTRVPLVRTSSGSHAVLFRRSLHTYFAILTRFVAKSHFFVIYAQATNMPPPGWRRRRRRFADATTLRCVAAAAAFSALAFSTTQSATGRRRLDAIPTAALVLDLTGSIQELTYKLPLEVGTPSVTMELRIDTGSTETYVPTSVLCADCAAKSGKPIGKSGILARWNPFNCSQSSSCALAACTGDVCTGSTCDAACWGSSSAQCDADDAALDDDVEGQVSAPCCAAADPSSCGFSALYGDGSTVAGALASDTFRLGPSILLRDMPFGACWTKACMPRDCGVGSGWVGRSRMRP